MVLENEPNQWEPVRNIYAQILYKGQIKHKVKQAKDVLSAAWKEGYRDEQKYFGFLPKAFEIADLTIVNAKGEEMSSEQMILQSMANI